MLPEEIEKLDTDRMRPAPVMDGAPPETVSAPVAVYVPAPTASVPPESVDVPVTFSAPLPSVAAPPTCVNEPVTLSVPVPTASVTLLPSVTFDVENVPFTLIVAGAARTSETTLVAVGTTSVLQFSASPQSLVPAPPSQLIANPPVLPRAK